MVTSKFLLGCLVVCAAAAIPIPSLLNVSMNEGYGHPAVFSPYFYTNNNPDVPNQSQEDAFNHWVTYGLKEGRQACGSFHVRQYLDRYPDLKQAFGNNFIAAANHYLQHGLAEGRLGFLEGGGYGRWTIHDASTGTFISGSQRVAGAIDSIVFGRFEFINAWDHGREMQVAITVNNLGDRFAFLIVDSAGECFNPTEAGSNRNGAGEGTSSQLLGASSDGNALRTTVAPPPCIQILLNSSEGCIIIIVLLLRLDCGTNRSALIFCQTTGSCGDR
jgi:hypothetical protein